MKPDHIYTYFQGQRAHYQVAGPAGAPALLLLHGLGGNVNWWQANIPAFSRHFRVYALDLPGFGYSWRLRHRPTIAALAGFVIDWMNRIGLEQVNLLGHSMGGQVAVRLASGYPDRIIKLVLAAPSGLRTPLAERTRWVWRMPKVVVPLRQTLTIASGTMRTDLLALGLSLGSIITDWQMREALATLTVPSLLLWGTADGVLPPALGPRMLELMVNAPVRLQYIARGTHNLMFDQAAAFNHLVLEFLLAE